MTTEQASERFGVPLGKLQLYEKLGLFDCHKQPDGSVDYDDGLMDYIGIINVLMDAGAEICPRAPINLENICARGYNPGANGTKGRRASDDI